MQTKQWPKKRRYDGVRFSIYPYLFIAPTMILIGIFSYYAFFNGLWNSLTDYRITNRVTEFVGFENYRTLFGPDGLVFWKSFGNQAIITAFSVINAIFWPLLTAELLFFVRRKRIANTIKSMFVMPMLVPGIVVTLIWRFLYNKSFGFNSLLNTLGLKMLTHDWMKESGTAMFSVIFMGFPFVSGLNFLIFHSAVNNVGTELYEAAVTDGANNWQVVRHVHIPNVMGYVSVIATLSLIGSLSGFGSILATTNGGPGNTTMVPALLMYRIAFTDGRFGYASAMAVVIMLIILVLTAIQRKLVKGDD